MIKLHISKKITPIHIGSVLKYKDKTLAYGDTVTRRYSELNNLSKNIDPHIMYEHYIIANQEALKTLLSKKHKYVINTLQ